VSRLRYHLRMFDSGRLTLLDQDGASGLCWSRAHIEATEHRVIGSGQTATCWDRCGLAQANAVDC
jgi:hypothetical protein